MRQGKHHTTPACHRESQAVVSRWPQERAARDCAQGATHPQPARDAKKKWRFYLTEIGELNIQREKLDAKPDALAHPSKRF
jgi:hypothetical protein